MDKEKDVCIGVIVCRLDFHGQSKSKRGYIAMLAVSKEYRKRKIGSSLVLMAIESMKTAGADEVNKNTVPASSFACAERPHGRIEGRNITHPDHIFFLLDCARDRIHKPECDRAVSADGLHQGQAALPLLPQRRGCLPAKTVLQTRSSGASHRRSPIMINKKPTTSIWTSVFF